MQIIIDIPDETYEIIKENKPITIAIDVFELIKNGTPLPKDNKCRWIRFDHRTMCPQNHDINNPYWRIPENRVSVLKFCPYCGKEIVIDEISN